MLASDSAFCDAVVYVLITVGLLATRIISSETCTGSTEVLLGAADTVDASAAALRLRLCSSQELGRAVRWTIVEGRRRLSQTRCLIWDAFIKIAGQCCKG